MQVWRKKTVRYVIDGEKVASGTHGAAKETIKSKRFYGTLRLADGRTKQVPLSEDRDASQTLYVPDRKLEQAEIAERHRRDLHFVGDWHTHREPCPRPSRTDLRSIAESVRRSKHGLNGFLLVIVGQADPPAGLFVSVSDGATTYELLPVNPAPSTRDAS